MRILICLFSFILFGVALADEKNTGESLTPVYEPVTSNISERLEKIEKQLNNSALLEMLESLESLKTEINTLRGEIEVQTHTIDQLKKITSMSHGEHNKPEFANEKSIEKKIKEQKNIFGLGFSYRKIDLDNTFPKYILDNKDKYKEWII